MAHYSSLYDIQTLLIICSVVNYDFCATAIRIYYLAFFCTPCGVRYQLYFSKARLAFK